MSTRLFDFTKFIDNGMDRYERIVFFTDTYYIWKGLHGLSEDDAFFKEFLADSTANAMFKGLDGCFVEPAVLSDIKTAWLTFKEKVSDLIKGLDEEERMAYIYNNRNSVFLFSEHGCAVLDIVDYFPIATVDADPSGVGIVVDYSVQNKKTAMKHTQAIEEVFSNQPLLQRVYDYAISQTGGNQA